MATEIFSMLSSAGLFIACMRSLLRMSRHTALSVYIAHAMLAIGALAVILGIFLEDRCWSGRWELIAASLCCVGAAVLLLFNRRRYLYDY